MLSNAQLSTEILDLLYTKKQVILPGIGTFILLPQMASIDHVSGILNPPANELTFRDSFDADNEELTNTLADKFSLSEEQVSFELQIFIKNLRFRLLDKRSFEFEGIGVLSYDEEKELVFEASDEEVDGEFYGLSQIAFRPIERDRAEVLQLLEETMELTPKSIPGSAPAVKSRFSLFSSFSFLVLFFFLFSCFVLNDYFKQERKSDTTFKAVKTRLVNVSPQNVSPQSDKNKHFKKELQPASPKVNQHKVVFYTFSKEANADKAYRKIRKLGHEAFKSTSKGKFQVGVELSAAKLSTLHPLIESIQEEIGARSYFLVVGS